MAGRDYLRIKVNEILKAENHPAVSPEQIDAIFKGIALVVTTGEKIQLQGFGTFARHLQAPRLGRNPKTGEPLQIPGKAKLHFQSNMPPFVVTEEEMAKMSKPKVPEVILPKAIPPKAAKVKSPPPVKS